MQVGIPAIKLMAGELQVDQIFGRDRLNSFVSEWGRKAAGFENDFWLIVPVP
jgi:hypothetical protein